MAWLSLGRVWLVSCHPPQHAHDLLDIEHGCQKMASLSRIFHEWTKRVYFGQEIGGILQAGGGLPDPRVTLPSVASFLKVDDLCFQA